MVRKLSYLEYVAVKLGKSHVDLYSALGWSRARYHIRVKRKSELSSAEVVELANQLKVKPLRLFKWYVEYLG